MIRQIVEGRAARICAAAVTVFLCVLTLLEFTALELEWEIPALQVVSGEHSFWSEEYQKEEQALDDSAENELMPEEEAHGMDESAAVADESVIGMGENAADGKADEISAGTGETSGDGADGTEADAAYANGKETKDTSGSSELNSGEDAGKTDPVLPEFPYYIRINRRQNCITIYTQDEEGEYTVPCKAMVCSTGLYNATPRGTFQISTKYLWRELYGGVYGQYATRIHGGVLFHSVPYYKKSKSSLCTDKYNKLGQQASMGCVRLTVEDAKWIAENCPTGTTVEIYEDDDPGPLGKPEPMKIDTDNPNKGWDPTDPDEDNPWRELSEDL